ncbi:MAG: hypothetical protein ACMG6E_00865 [Candidatus Roizmanbacteria bacterium]
MKKQTIREQQLVTSFKRCSRQNTIDPSDIVDLKEQLRLAKYLSHSYYDAQIMELLFCSFDTTVTVAGADDDYEASPQVREFFAGLHQIGADSVEGFALFAGFKDVQDLFVIKVPKDPEVDGLFHEYFIGVAGLNPLRKYVPNFSYIFAAFRCLPPDINQDKTVTKWCSAPGSSGASAVNYVVFEKIPGKGFSDSMSKLLPAKDGFTTYLSYLIQLAFALRLAQQQCDFTHYDLHGDNVILRDLPEDGPGEIYIPYLMKKGTIVFVKTKAIATIIDYGRSHIAVKKEHFGYHNFEENGVYATRSRVLYDLFKIIGFTLYEARKNSQFLFKSIDLLMMWPNVSNTQKLTDAKSVLKFIRESRDSYFELPPQVTDFEEEADPLLNFLDTLAERYPKEWQQIVFSENGLPEDAKILNCQNMTCDTLDEARAQLISPTPVINDYY